MQSGRLARTVTSHWRPANAVMFHAGRCGSTVLGQMLGETRRVRWLGELYDHRVAIGALPDPAEPGAHLRLLETQMVNAGSRYFGFEVRFAHLRALHLELGDWLTTLDGLGFTHFLVLQRRNTLKALVSTQIASKGGPYHQRAGTPPVLRTTTVKVVRTSPLGIEVPLVDRLRRREEEYAHLDRCLAGRNVLKLTYEQDVEHDPGVGYGRICSFLGVKAAAVPARLGRTNPFPLAQLIHNFDEVADALDGSPYAWMLDDDH